MPPLPIVNVDLDAWFADTLGGAGNGKGDRMGVGMGNSSWAWKNRFAIRLPRPPEFADIQNASQLTGLNVKLRVSNALFGIGSGVKFYLERGTTAFIETSENRRDFVSSSGGAAGKWPGPTRDATDRGQYEGSPANNDWIAVPMPAALAQWWWTHTEVTSLVLVGLAFDETLTAQRCVFYTRESGSAPYAEPIFTTNLAPNIPTDLSPADEANVPSTLGTQATVQGRHTDPDGDSSTKYQAQWFDTSVVDGTADASTPIADNEVTATTPHNALRSHTFTGLAARTAGKWRMRFFDGVAWGPWSLLRTATTAYQPSVVNPATEPGTTTPKFYDSITSADSGEFATAYQDVVYQDTPQGTITKWDSGKVAVGGSPTRVERTYGGSAIVYGTPYRRKRRLWNRDDVPTTADADWPQTALNVAFTQYEAVGAIVKIGSSAGPVLDPATKIDDTTPTFNIAAIGGGNIDQIRLWTYNKITGALLDDSGVVSFTAAANRNYTVPASAALDWGMELEIIAAVRISGNANMGPPSERKTGHMNVAPGAPGPITVSGGQTVQRSDGVWVTTDSTPDVLIPFRDLDKDLGYTETPERQEVEMWVTATGLPFGASPFIDATDPSETFTTPALTVEQMYHLDARYDDTAAARSVFSELAFIKYSAAPTLTSVSPADGATITVPTPTFEGTYGHTGGVAEASRRLILREGQTVVYDSLEQEPGDIEVPADTLPNETDLDYELISTNADGLTATATGTITTDFTQPDPITGLTLTPDEDVKGLLIEWDESDLTEDEFEAYFVYAKPAGGQFRLLETITDKTETSLLYQYAVHNAESVVRVTQTNGWMESEPTEASETLGGEDDDAIRGYWDVGPDGAYELTHISDPSGDTATQIEKLPLLNRSTTDPNRRKTLRLNWGTSGFEGSFRLFSDDRELVDRLRKWKEAGTVRLLKFPYGKSLYVRYTSTPTTDRPASWIDQQVTFEEVDPDEADFD